MDKIIVNLKELLMPVLAALGITFLTSGEDHIQVFIEVNSIGFYIILAILSWFSIWSLSKVWRRCKNTFYKFQAKNYEEIKSRCNGRSSK